MTTEVPEEERAAELLVGSWCGLSDECPDDEDPCDVHAVIGRIIKERNRWKAEAEGRARWTARTMPRVRDTSRLRKRERFRLRRTIKRVKAASRRDLNRITKERDEARAALRIADEALSAIAEGSPDADHARHCKDHQQIAAEALMKMDSTAKHLLEGPGEK